jgi:hypothetical protein
MIEGETEADVQDFLASNAFDPIPVTIESILNKTVVVMTEDFSILARLRRGSMSVACDRGETKPELKKTAQNGCSFI